MAESKIEWTDYTFNPWRGCTKVSPGCQHCYAETMSKRNPATLGVWGPDSPRVLAAENYWQLPHHWNRRAEEAGVRKKVFCASLADWLDNSHHQLVDTQGNRLYWQPTDERMRPWQPRNLDGSFLPDGRHWSFYGLECARARLLLTIHATPHLDWLLLTKRPENFLLAMEFIELLHDQPGALAAQWRHGSAMPNIWLGVSVEDQARADERIPLLLQTPAPVHFLSCEPLLGPLDLSPFTFRARSAPADHAAIDWVIAGGESGPHARPMHPDWARSLRDQCAAAGIPFFFKQWGEWVPEGQGDTAPEGATAATTIVKNGSDYCALFKCGKRHAGRLFDGQLHHAFPAPACV